MTKTTSILWHDYEAWGVNPRVNFPSQFAAIRTDLDLNIIDEPIVLYAHPPKDRLPHPEACLITRQTPQRVIAQEPLSEYEFIRAINAEMSKPGTCTVGYNNLRFDDEVTRFALYRNLIDPYAREWQNGCSRWDILDVLRLARALRPEGITWPVNEEGQPSMRLEDLSKANNIDHGRAHDALVDVYATIEMAQLLKKHQPKLYDYAFNNRDKNTIKNKLSLTNPEMQVHISGMYKSEFGNMAVVAPIAEDPGNSNAIAVFDLRFDPQIMETGDIEHLHYLMFTKQDELKENEARLPIKTIHTNKCPILTPLNTLSPEACEKYQIDLGKCEENFQALSQIPDLSDKIQKVLSLKEFDPVADPDQALYQGFIDRQDRGRLNKIISTNPAELNLDEFKFADSRLPELAFRFKARNYPEHLSESEQARWNKFCYENIRSLSPTLNEYLETIEAFKEAAADDDLQILKELVEWAKELQS
jgi:exodeoxyribonuclease I